MRLPVVTRTTDDGESERTMKRLWMPVGARRRALLVGVGAAILAAATVHAGVPEDPPFEHETLPGVSPEPILEGAGLRGAADLEAFFDGVMAAHLAAQRIAGAAVAVVKDGAPYFTKGYGHADVGKRTPVDPSTTLFRAGSATKLVTWTAVMQLVEQGKLDLDADVGRYVPQFDIPPTFDQPITLRNLMTHTPGLEDAIVSLFARKPEDVAPLAESLQRHMPARVRPPTTDFTDGMNVSYSNWGAALAGLIVANVSGVDFDEYVEGNVLRPLGMTRSTMREPLPPGLAPHLSAGYGYEEGRHRAGNFEFVSGLGPAGSLTSTASDVARFMIAHLQDGRYGDHRILGEETARYMQARRLSPSPYVDGAGLGFYETWINGRRWIGHGGDTVYFHTNLSLLKEENLGIYVAYNSAPVLPFSARDDLLKAFMDRYYPARLPAVEPPGGFGARAAKYAGEYRVIKHSYAKNERLFGLAASITIEPTGDGTLRMKRLGAPVASQWVEVAPSLFRRIDGEDVLFFPEDADGGVRGFVWPFPFHAAYRVTWYDTLRFHGVVAAWALLSCVAAILGALRHWGADRAAPAVV
ncbi:MAG: serine hydrolase domain-containing protein, partial [Candidatus Binatia bacterium]